MDDVVIIGDFAEVMCTIVACPEADMNTLPFSQRPTVSPRAVHKDDVMMEFHSEHQLRRPQRQRRRTGAWVGVLCGVVVLAAAGVWALRSNLFASAHTGSLRIESDPAGAAIDIDGSPRGLTPLTLELTPGVHVVSVTHGDQTQEISATVTAGALDTHHIHWSALLEETGVPAKGRLRVSSDPPGGTVTVDGVARGVSPMSVHDLEPGEHEVVVQLRGRTHRRTIAVEAGATSALVLSNAPVGTESGWLAARASTALQIFEKGRLLGTTDSERLVLPAGSHDLEFVADALGFRARRMVAIAAGQTTSVSMSLPQAAVNLNAVPWADVAIDGKDIGQTPLANLMLTIGAHQVTFRHPELGEKHATVTVSLTEPARVAVDMRGR